MAGPYRVNKIPNPFKVQYEDEGGEKITHARNCKKFRGQANNGNKQPIANKGCLRVAKVQCQVRRQRRMTCHIIDVLAEGSKWTFQNPAHFCKWLRGREENSADIYIRGVPGRGGHGSTEVAQFLAKQLRLPKPLYMWQRRKLAYLRKRCGHRSGEAGVVCESLSRNIQAQHQPLAATSSKPKSPSAMRSPIGLLTATYLA